MFAASEEEAVLTTLLVLALTALVPEAIATASPLEAFPTVVFVFALTEAVPAVIFAPILEANDEDALPTTLLVFAFTLVGIFAASDDEAIPTTLAVFALTAEFPVEIASARALDALLTEVFVFALIFAANELDAFVTSDCTASEPELRDAPVRVRVVAFQTSVARVPNVVRERVPADQTAVATSVVSVPKEVRVRPLNAQTADGMEVIAEARDEEALATVVLVLELTLAGMLAERDEEAALISLTVFTSTAAAISVVDAPVYPMTNVLSKLAKSPPPILPHVIVVGQTPSVYNVVVL